MKKYLLPITLKAKIILLFFKILIKKTRKISEIFHAIQFAGSQLKKAKGFFFLNKVFQSNGKYYWNLYLPGYPSKPFEYIINTVISKAFNSNVQSLNVLIIAITKKCSLNCEHCFEWDEINKKDTLTEEIITNKISEYFRSGYFGQIFFSGGEPLNRYSMLLSLIKKYGRKSECWFISSGLGFDDSKATELKQAGLTGIVISLDDYSFERHDEFRGFSGAHLNAVNALKNAGNVNLLTALSLCPTKDHLSREFLDEYMAYAKQLKVSFVQIIEPRAQGKFKEKDVVLEQNHLELLETIYTEYSTLKKYKDFPLLFYPDYDKRLTGCRGMEWYAYMDTDGYIYPCPFCKETCQQCESVSTKKIAVSAMA